MKVLIIVPAYNEEENIVGTVESIKKYREKCDFTLDYIVVNDGSTDNTESVCKNNGINVMSHSVNLGIGGAVQSGYKLAEKLDYDIAVQFDGDGQHDINSLKNLILPIINNECDFVVGSRFIENKAENFKSTAMRRVGIKIISFMIGIFGKIKILDCTSGYRASSKAVTKIFAYDYPVDYPEPESIVEISKKGYRIKEVSVNMFERTGGKSSIRAWKSVYYMIKVVMAIIITGFQRR